MEKWKNTKATSIADGNVKIESFTRIMKYFMAQKYFFKVRNKTNMQTETVHQYLFFAVDYL